MFSWCRRIRSFGEGSVVIALAANHMGEITAKIAVLMKAPQHMSKIVLGLPPKCAPGKMIGIDPVNLLDRKLAS